MVAGDAGDLDDVGELNLATMVVTDHTSTVAATSRTTPRPDSTKRSAGHQAQAAGLPADAEYSLPGTRPGRRTRLLLGSLLRTLDRRQGPRTARRPEPPRHSPPRIPGI